MKFRGKKYITDSEWVPRAGIRLLEKGTDLESPVPVADVRVDKLNLPKVFQHLQRYFETLPLDEVMVVRTSWDNLREELERLPKMKTHFPPMRLVNLPAAQVINESTILTKDVVDIIADDEIPELMGEKYPELVEEGEFANEVVVGMDVAIYTQEKTTRPWIGVVKSVS